MTTEQIAAISRLMTRWHDLQSAAQRAIADHHRAAAGAADDAEAQEHRFLAAEAASRSRTLDQAISELWATVATMR